MIKGKSIEEKKYLTIDEILSATNGGYDIFRLYLGKVAKIMNRPWGHKEKKMSWGVFSRNGTWFWKDQATEESGTAIHFVEKMFNLNFKEAKDKICFDFNLGAVKNPTPIKVTWEAPPEEDKDYCDINFSHQPFKEYHHKFWNAAEVTESHCLKYNCFAVKDAAINKKRIFIGENEPVFAYYAEDEDSVKLYFPEREKDKKFRNNVSYHYLWNYENIQSCKDLIVQKSVKDMLVTTLITPCCIATQAEAVKIFNKEVVDKINSVTKSPWIWYGSDWDGVKKCKEITDSNKWRYINTPKNLLPEINDSYGFVKKFGIKQLELFMIKKGLIN